MLYAFSRTWPCYATNIKGQQHSSHLVHAFKGSGGVSARILDMNAAGNLSPILIFPVSSTSCLIFSRSASDSVTFAAPGFSSMYVSCLDPGIGIVPCATSQAIETCAAVAGGRCAAPIAWRPAMRERMVGKFCLLYFAIGLRKSPSSKSSGDF